MDVGAIALSNITNTKVITLYLCCSYHPLRYTHMNLHHLDNQYLWSSQVKIHFENLKLFQHAIDTCPTDTCISLPSRLAGLWDRIKTDLTETLASGLEVTYEKAES